MTSRERVRRALRFEGPDRVPRCLWKLPGVDRVRRGDLERILSRYPEDIVHPIRPYGRGVLQRGERYRIGETATDEWGCDWQVAEDGVAGEVKEPPIRELRQIRNLEAPYEILEGADRAPIDALCGSSEQFVVAWTTVRPFERMQFLVGTETLLIELAGGSREMNLLQEGVHRFFLAEIDWWCATGVDGIMFMDDWGSQQSLLVSPELWRSRFKPLYREYCERIHAAGKHVFFHSDGNIEQIYGDLIEIGVDAVNSQLFCMDIERLGSRHRGRITFWGEIDRQRILPFGTPEEVRRAVRRVIDALWAPEGGVIAQCELGLKDPVRNIEEVYETWREVL